MKHWRVILADWTGNRNSIYKTLGASSHTDKERQADDFYATEPFAIDVLLNDAGVVFEGSVWEPACGEGHLSERLKHFGYEVVSTDLIDRGYGQGGVDFLKSAECLGNNIVTNPPYKYALEFCQHAYDLVPGKVAMFLRLQFLEGKKRKAFFSASPPWRVFVSSSRLLCAKNADFNGMRAGGGSAVAYGWFVWKKGFAGETVVSWVN
jgi:hypothetical protein